MKATCPNCGEVIPVGHLALEGAQVECPECEEVFALEDVLKEHAPAIPEPRILERPSDARTVVERPYKQLFIYIPATGFRREHVAGLGCAIPFLALGALLGAVAVVLIPSAGWISIAVKIGFALVSIPFWLVSLLILVGVLSAAGVRRIVYLDESWMARQGRWLLFRRRRMIDRSHVQGARPGKIRPDVQFSSGHDASRRAKKLVPGVRIVLDKGTEPISCQSEAEADWLAGQINAFLQTVPYKAPLNKEGPEEFAQRREEHRVTRGRQRDRPRRRRRDGHFTFRYGSTYCRG